MTKLSQKVLAAISAGTLLLGVVSPVFADTTLVISGNGADSSNGVTLTQSSATTVVQSNSANIQNNVDASANTGSNDANRNTGGATTIDTGNAKTDVAVSNTVNSNAASVSCCAAGNNTSVLISGNGADSANGVTLGQGSDSSISVFQDNNANISNAVDANANTGKNDAKSNTGGNVSVSTGDATTKVAVNNTANANSATVGGGSQSGNGLVDLKILGNGTGSDNSIDLTLDHSIVLTQSNSAQVSNEVDANSNTGKNDANRNTGGDVTIDTGNAKTNVNVDNAVNFNFAAIDCGCLIDVTGKVAGNGADSSNNLVASLGSDQAVFQNNCGVCGSTCGGLLTLSIVGCKLDNNVDANASSGKNDNKSNTGTVNGGDPSVFTGNAESNTDISNSGNANAYGVSSSIGLPTFDFGFNLNGLSWSVLWALLGH